jgi:hypothetical protein
MPAIHALIPLLNPVDPSRPVFVHFRGGVVFIVFHDLWYQSRKRYFMELLKTVHTDCKRNRRKTAIQSERFPGETPNNVPLTGASFRLIRARSDVFEADQLDFYRKLGLTPPHVKHGASGFSKPKGQETVPAAMDVVAGHRTRNAALEAAIIMAYST